jgi:3-phenylpropionate/cinnamic acid dioxygenase small subunit
VLSIEDVVAQLEITRLVYAYADCVDRGDYDGVAELFRDAGMSSEGSDHVDRGYDAIHRRYVDWTRRLDDDGTPHTKHVTTNVVIDVDHDAGTAEGRAYFTVFQQTDVLPLQPIIAGRYRDRFERVDGTWRFAHRHMVPDLFGDLSQHLLLPVGPDAASASA